MAKKGGKKLQGAVANKIHKGGIKKSLNKGHKHKSNA